MRIDAVHIRLQWILDSVQAGQFSREEIDDALDMWSIKLFNDYLPEYGKNMDSREALQAFKTYSEFETNESGEFEVKSCERLLECRINVIMGDSELKKFDARILNDDEVSSRLNSQLRPVQIEYPFIQVIGERQIDQFAEITAKQYKLYPEVETGGKLGYLRRPKRPKFAYTVANEEEVFDMANSVNLEWGAKYIDRIILGAISLLGVSLDNNWLRENGLLLESAMNNQANA